MKETSRTFQYAEVNGSGTVKEEADIGNEWDRLYVSSTCFVLSR